MRSEHRLIGRTRLGRGLALGAVGALTLLGPAAAQAPAARARLARTVDLQETGSLHAVGEPGTVVDEHGHATGTYSCAIVVQLTIVSPNRVTATFTVKPSGGTVTGTGSGRMEQQGADSYFGGTIAITSGSGSFAHASGSDIGISGVVDRETLALTVHVHGQVET
jgi:hypothetical protein